MSKEEVFISMDTDGNKVISGDEYRANREKMLPLLPAEITESVRRMQAGIIGGEEAALKHLKESLQFNVDMGLKQKDTIFPSDVKGYKITGETLSLMTQDMIKAVDIVAPKGIPDKA